ncbi:MAG: thioredoxin domain-containing protein [Deltaproteobacteria bacterium]|nr:thioredoxin domain-containing protein [Deltaproteobacteria bacterium]
MLEKYPKDVKLAHKFLPRHGEMPRKAALAALAADDQGKFWEFSDELFKNQGGLDDAKLVEIAAGLKMDVDRFKARMKHPAVEKVIDGDLREAQALGVRWTPKPYVNGLALPDNNFQTFVNAIDGELRK